MSVLSSIFFFFFFLLFSIPVTGNGGVKLNRLSNDISRRILHQPLFPVPSTPPPDFELASLPIPPAAPDMPFFPEITSTLDQSQYPPPPPPSASAAVNDGLPIPIPTTQPAKNRKKAAIVISVGIVTLGMVSGLAFFLYRHKAKHASETQKLVSGGADGGSLRFQEDPRPPTTSTFLNMKTVEPESDSSSESGREPVNSSPNRNFNSVKSSDRYRRSLELQPLPPLARPQPFETSQSALSPSSSSSDEECRDTAFYIPHRSTISSDGSFHKPFPLFNNSNSHSSRSIPHSKRTSPRSKFGLSATAGTMSESKSPEMKHVIIPSVNQKPALVQPPPLRGFESEEEALPYSYNKPKFSQPPPSPNRVAFQAITQDNSPLSSLKPPRRSPPPPPPPLPLPPQKWRLRDSQARP